MGILRTDRITGLGGANAIKGSVFFPHDGTATTTSGALQVNITSLRAHHFTSG